MQHERAHEAGEAAVPARFVCFHLHGQEYAIPIVAVRETIGMRPITRVFLTPSWLAGIFSLRGEVVPVVDVALWLGLPPTEIGADTRMLVLRQGTKVLAILADDLAELRSIPKSLVATAIPTLSPEQLALLAGVAATPTGTVRLIDPEALFASERLKSLSSAPT